MIVTGLPCSGKSTLAEGIAQKLSIPIFSVDPIESAVIQSGIERSFETGLAAYLVAKTLADEQLKVGQSVIIDAVSPVQEAREMWKGLERKFGVKRIVIECQLDEKLHKKRVEDRTRNMHGIPEVTWEQVEDVKRDYLDWDEERLILNTAMEQEDSLKKVLEYIDSILSKHNFP